MDKLYFKCGGNLGFKACILDVAEKKGERKKIGENGIEYYISLDELRKNYKDYANWNSFTEYMVGNISYEIMKQVKRIVKTNYDIGYSLSDTLNKIYYLIHHDDSPIFPEDKEDMQTAQILFDIAREWI